MPVVNNICIMFMGRRIISKKNISYRKQIPFPLLWLPLCFLLREVPWLWDSGSKDDVKDALDCEDDDGDHPDQVPLVSVAVVPLDDLSGHSRSHEARN